jgi:hypothetical protein
VDRIIEERQVGKHQVSIIEEIHDILCAHGFR